MADAVGFLICCPTGCSVYLQDNYITGESLKTASDPVLCLCVCLFVSVYLSLSASICVWVYVCLLSAFLCVSLCSLCLLEEVCRFIVVPSVSFLKNRDKSTFALCSRFYPVSVCLCLCLAQYFPHHQAKIFHMLHVCLIVLVPCSFRP